MSEMFKIAEPKYKKLELPITTQLLFKIKFKKPQAYFKIKTH